VQPPRNVRHESGPTPRAPGWPARLLAAVCLCAVVLACGCSGGGGGDGGGDSTADTTPPSIVSTFPINGATGAAVNAVLVATFSEGMDPATLNTTTFTLNDSANHPVSGQVAYSGFAATFAPGADLGFSVVYTATITKGAKDRAGNALSGDFSWTFTTAPETTPPSVISTAPSDGETGVSLTGPITATFSETMALLTLDTATFTLKDASNKSVSGTVTYAGVTATFTPSAALSYSGTYTATLSTDMRDLAGNALQNSKAWNFTTRGPALAFSAVPGFLPIGANNGALISADFNGDGKQDLAVTRIVTPGIVLVLLGDGTGSFAAKPDFTAGEGPRAIAVADFNNDAKPDMAVANETFRFPLPAGTVSILIGDGLGNFASPTNLDVGKRPLDVVSGYFNADAIPDLATANQFSDDVSVLIGSGAGGFLEATHFALPAGAQPMSIAMGDFNKDTALDLATAGENLVCVLLGAGTGSFGTPSCFPSGVFSVFVAAGDLNGDGNLDLAISNDGTDHLTILMGDGNGSFGTGRTVLAGQYPKEIKIVDLNADGFADLVVTTNMNGGIGRNAVQVLLGLGGGAFGSPIEVYNVGESAILLPRVAIGDYNGDTKPDIAIADPSLPPHVVVLLNATP
jgi:Bacterial Ig-like domain/FG-GAP-like repeat